MKNTLHNYSNPNLEENMASMININNSILFDKRINKKNNYNLTKNGEWVPDTNNNTTYKPICKWVNDSAVSKCYNCETDFTFYMRKHHCRLCGRIFCYNCSNNWKEIPRDIPIPTKIIGIKDKLKCYIYSDKLERVCISCKILLDEKKNIDVLLLSFRFLDIKTIKNILPSTKLIYKAGLQYLTIFRGIQYKFFTQPLATYEYDILISNAEYFSGHSKWIFYLQCSQYKNIIDIIKNSKNTNCKNLLCCSSCKNHFNGSDIIQLLYSNLINDETVTTTVNYIKTESQGQITNTLKSNRYHQKKILLHKSEPLLEKNKVNVYTSIDNIKQYIYIILNNIPDTELICYIPILIELIKNNNKEVKTFIIKKLTENNMQNNKLLFLFIWEICRNKLEFNKLNSDLENRINNIKNMFYSLQTMNFYNNNNYKQIIKTSFETIDNFYVFCNNKTFVGIDYDNINIIKSKSSPILIPLILKDSNGKQEIKKFLFKKDSLFKDYIICKVIKLMIYLLKQDSIIEHEYITYDIFLLSDTSGFIEVIDNAETIYNIKYKYNTTILNYILENNKHKTINEVRLKFIYSLAVYSVISYLLGIGDRHLNNIMIHKNGSLFHIDFSYILGYDPKFKITYIRLSDDMLEAVGGKNSENYNFFKEKCSNIFNCLRKHLGIISTLLSILTLEKDTVITKEYLTNELLEKWEPNEKYVDASLHIKTIIDNSHDNVTSTVFDTFYKIANYLR